MRGCIYAWRLTPNEKLPGTVWLVIEFRQLLNCYRLSKLLFVTIEESVGY